jgi:hypothetical protein
MRTPHPAEALLVSRQGFAHSCKAIGSLAGLLKTMVFFLKILVFWFFMVFMVFWFYLVLILQAMVGR